MKQSPNAPESPELLIQCFTNPEEWDAAKWGATASLYDPSGASRDYPKIGIAFENFDAGKRIFDGWIARLGHVDLHEELRISIIEGPIPSDPVGYTVFISSNLNSDHKPIYCVHELSSET